LGHCQRQRNLGGWDEGVHLRVKKGQFLHAKKGETESLRMGGERPQCGTKNQRRPPEGGGGDPLYEKTRKYSIDRSVKVPGTEGG